MRKRFHQGIAIGPILMVIALMAVIAGVMAAGQGTFSTNTTVDRIRVDLKGQSNLIRSKIQECYMITMGDEGFGYPTGSGTTVRNLDCPGDPAGQRNLWSGRRPVSLPPMLSGFSDWVYYNTSAGRCIRTTPATPSDASIQQGITSLAASYNVNEVHVDSSGDWSLSIWLTPKATPAKCGS